MLSLSRLLFLVSFSCLFSLVLRGQGIPGADVQFDFNDHTFNEKNNKVIPRPVGVSLVEDRFGNEKSAIYVHGHVSSYLNLGTSELLKPKKGTISIWANLIRRVYSGKGYDSNPVIITKNGPQSDWNCAYIINYESYDGRFGSTMSADSLKEVIIHSDEKISFDKWYHLVITFDDDYFAFYINGILQGKFRKGFETIYYDKDLRN
jgi:hypothetical protein